MGKDVVNLELGRRLAAARAARGLSQGALATIVGMKQTAIGEIEAGRVMRPKKLREIARAVGKSEEWLLGELERVPPGREFEPDPEFNPDGALAFAAGQPFSPVVPGGRPEIDVRPGAGHGQDGLQVAFTTDAGGVITGHRVVAEWVMPDPFFRHELRASPDGTIFMEVIGNSMLPTLAPGDRVIVDTRQNTFGPDAIYVFDDGDGEPRVKSLKKMLGTGEVRIISDNRDSYGEDVMSLASIRIIGRVVGKVSKL